MRAQRRYSDLSSARFQSAQIQAFSTVVVVALGALVLISQRLRAS
jgi:hypothetical protein